MSSKDYLVTIRVRNNRMLQKMREVGFETSSDLSRASGVDLNAISRCLNLKTSPYRKGGSLSKVVLKLSETLRCLPDDMFPEKHLVVPLRKNKAEFEADSNDFEALTSSLRSLALPADEKLLLQDARKSLYELVDTLNDKEKKVIVERFGLLDGNSKTLDEIAKDFNVGKERIRQIEAKALRRLKERNRRDKNLSVSDSI